jgi:hypothetical protein
MDSQWGWKSADVAGPMATDWLNLRASLLVNSPDLP